MSRLDFLKIVNVLLTMPDMYSAVAYPGYFQGGGGVISSAKFLLARGEGYS